VARNIWGDESYYSVLLSDDPVYEAALKALSAVP
jgi:hypothetical protein